MAAKHATKHADDTKEPEPSYPTYEYRLEAVIDAGHLNALGAEGWLMVGHLPDRGLAIFARPTA